MCADKGNDYAPQAKLMRGMANVSRCKVRAMSRPTLLFAAALCSATVAFAADELAANGVDKKALEDAAAQVVQRGLDAAPSPTGLTAKSLKDLSPQARVALVKASLGAVRAFLDSAAGRGAVAALAMDPPPKNPEDELNEAEKQQAAMKVEDMLVGVPKEQHAQMRKALEQMKKDMAAQLQQARSNLKAGRDEWKQAQAQWEAQRADAAKQVPAKLAQVLTTFLAETKGMPWDAKLKAQGGLQVFTDKALEAKPRWWKLCFRAGKDSVDAARTFAEGWLKALKPTP